MVTQVAFEARLGFGIKAGFTTGDTGTRNLKNIVTEITEKIFFMLVPSLKGS